LRGLLFLAGGENYFHDGQCSQRGEYGFHWRSPSGGSSRELGTAFTKRCVRSGREMRVGRHRRVISTMQESLPVLGMNDMALR
jgi:hypothetical protein